MVSSRETAASLFGAWRLARLDPSGIAWFNATEAGFWHSFFAAVLCAPAYALVVALDYMQMPVDASDARIISVHAIAYVINWTAFPLAMSWATRLLDREDLYVRYIVAFNWAKVLETLLFVPAKALAVTGVPWLTALPGFTALVVSCYQWYVARTALEISGSHAVAVIGLDLALDIALMMALAMLLPDLPI
jgi:hypothetical protein